MLEMLDKNILALTMHDSFIVNEYNADALRTSMVRAFEEAVGVRCKISKKLSFPQWQTQKPSAYKRWFENAKFESFNSSYCEWFSSLKPSLQTGSIVNS